MNPSLLIVDDEELSRIALRKMVLATVGDFSEIWETDQGSAIMSLVRQHRPDLIFMDIRLPGMNGLDAAAQIQSVNPDSRIIIMTAYDHFSLAQRAVNLNLDGYLLKPVIESELRRILLATLARWRHQHNQELPPEALGRELLPGSEKQASENRLARDFLMGGRIPAQVLVEKLFQCWPAEDHAWNHALDFAYRLAHSAENLGLGQPEGSETFLEQALATMQRSADPRNWLEMVCLAWSGLIPQLDDADLSQKIRRYLGTTDMAVICLEHLADSLRLSPAYTSRLFKDLMGKNFAGYLGELRIQRASELVREHPDLTVEEISRQLGYNDPMYFNKLFKQATGMTIKEYQRSAT